MIPRESPRSNRRLQFAAARPPARLIRESNKSKADERPFSPVYPWHYTDSSLEYVGNFDAPISSSFRDVVPKGQTFKEYIDTVCVNRRGQAHGLELGGVGSNLFRGFPSGLFKRTLGVSLTDYRTPKQEDADGKRGHECFSGDLADSRTYAQIQEWLHGEKFDVIIERMLSGFDYMPKDPLFLGAALDSVFGLLREGGVLFVQVPIRMRRLVHAWVPFAQKKCGPTLELQIADGYGDDGDPHDIVMLRIRKYAEAPAHLPLFGAKMVQSIEKSKSRV